MIAMIAEIVVYCSLLSVAAAAAAAEAVSGTDVARNRDLRGLYVDAESVSTNGRPRFSGTTAASGVGRSCCGGSSTAAPRFDVVRDPQEVSAEFYVRFFFQFPGNV